MNSYVIKLGNETFRTTVKLKDTDSSTFRYIKTFLQRKYKIDIAQKAIEHFNGTDICPFCGHMSHYNINYSVDNSNMLVEITGISLHKTKGFDNYHCKRGRSSNCEGSKLNPNSIEYLSKSLKISKNDANYLILKTNKSPFYKTNFSTNEEYLNNQKRNLDWYISKYSEERGLTLFNERNSKLSYKNSFIGLSEKYGEDIAKEISSKKASCSLDAYVKRYGEVEGFKKFKEHTNKTKQTLENFIIRHGDKLGNELYLAYLEKNRFKNTLEYYVQRHGEKEGKKLYAKWKQKIGTTKEQYIAKYGEDYWYERIKNQNNKSYSNESKIAIESLLNTLQKNFEIDSVKYAEEEYYIYDKDNTKIYFYDLYFNINNDKYIVEYDTPFMHPNQNFMSVSEYNNWVNPWDKEMTPKDKELFDINKRKLAESKGIKVFTFFVSKTNCVQKNINLVEKYLKDKYGIN